jgi:hypothetical protein
MKTLAATSSSRPNSEALTTCEVLAHPRVVSHPYTCGLCGGAAVIAATLINNNDVEVAVKTTMRRKQL